MLVIRLQRRGRKGLAVYRIVVQDKRTSPTREKVIARLGTYDPHKKETILDKELTQKYLDNGAQPSERAIGLLKLNGVKLPSWVAEPLKKEGKLKNADKLRKNQGKEVEEAVDTPEPEVGGDEKTVETTAEEAKE